jgi:hypothetical protein
MIGEILGFYSSVRRVESNLRHYEIITQATGSFIIETVTGPR